MNKFYNKEMQHNFDFCINALSADLHVKSHCRIFFPLQLIAFSKPKKWPTINVKPKLYLNFLTDKEAMTVM